MPSTIAIVMILLSSRLTSSFVLKNTRRYLTRRRTGSGEIAFFNEQTDLKVDESKMIAMATNIRKLLGYESYGLTFTLINDDEMQQLNVESRGVDAPTDVLSFQINECLSPGLLKTPQFDIPAMNHLGDVFVDVPYVTRQRNEDMEWEYEEDDDRGVSASMVDVDCVETRIHMLLLHGMLHLVGYDHIEDNDYELMVNKEEEFLEKLGLPVIKKK
jgi:probable rRNA maturation factor